MNVENLVVVFIDVNTHCLYDLVLMSITTFTVNKQPVPFANSPHPIPTSTISTTVKIHSMELQGDLIWIQKW